MLALIKPSDKSVKSIIQKDQSICVANINSSNQIILSGSVDSINEIIPFCKKEKSNVSYCLFQGHFTVT